MISNKILKFVSLAALVMLPLAGCSGTASSPAKVTEKGTEVTIGGQVDAKSAGKSVAKTAITANTVEVYNAQDGATLGSATIDSAGKFTGLAFTLPSTKTVLVFKATVAQGTFLSIVPIDLSNPPAAGTITGASPISIVISQESTAIAQLVSQMLGLSGDLGDAGMTLNSVTKTYADAAQLVVDNGGQQLAYGGGALALSGRLSSAALLPAMKAGDLSYDDLINTKLGGTVESAFIPGTHPIINFTVTNKNTGKGISGLTSFTLHVAQLKADGSTWLNYNLEKTENPTRPRQYLPATDSDSTVIDKGDGSYTVILGTDVTNSNALVLSKRDAATADSARLTYDASLIHRIAVSVTSAAPAKPINPATGATTSSFSPANVVALVYDFVPAAGTAYVNPNGGNFARDIVTMAACDSCHGQLVNHGHHFGSRPDTKVCVVCHTVQNKRTDKPSAEMTSLIHTLHMGEELPNAVTDIAGVDASEIKFPQDVRNCTTCHKGKDANNFKNKASANGCLTCHNNVVPSTGTNHLNTSVACATCHTEAGYKVDESHRTPVSTTNNPDLPAGVSKFSYEIVSVALDANRNPVIKFKILKDGVAVTSLNVPTLTANATTGLLSVPSAFQPITGFTGGPSLYVAYAVPQDGIAAPADFNNYLSVSLNNLLIASGSPKAGSIAGPDASGFFTATITGDMLGQVKSAGTAPAALNASPAYVPAGAKMVTATMIGGFKQVDKSLDIYVQQVTKAASSTDARRVIVSNNKCNSCHEQLGTKPVFHSGARNDATMCAMCHNPNRTSSGWAAESASFIHSLHGASKRSVPYVWHKTADWSGEAIGYPGILRNCEQCHVAGSYDFSNSAALIENVQYRAVATSGAYATNLSTELKTAANASYSPKEYMTAIGQVNPQVAAFTALSMSPYVSNGTFYGPNFAVVLANPVVFDSTGANPTAVTETILQAASTTLVSSPISAACFACHDTKAAKSHMVSNGGSIYEARSTALAKSESCLVCHGPRGADTTLPVTGAIPTIKTVHRWW